MLNPSLNTLADQFVEYKKQNGSIYQTGTYYLEKYLQFATEANPEITVPDRKSVEDFLEKYKNAPGSLYNAAAFLREFSHYLIARGYLDAYLIPTGRTRLPTPAPPYFLQRKRFPHFSGNATPSGMIRIIKAAIWYYRPCSVFCTAVVSAVRKSAYLPEKMCIWIKAILMSFNPKVPKAGESIFQEILRNIWMIMTGISAACSQNAECFSRTGLINLMVLLCLKKTFCGSGILPFQKSRIPE